jgi:hypothetical protein
MNNPNPINKHNSMNAFEISEDWKLHPMSAMIKSSASDSKTKNQAFIALWTKIILATHSYNFFTCFFFLGIAGFPTGAWLVIEAAAEIILLSDFVFREVLRLKFPEIWKIMQMIHDQSATNNRAIFGLALIASFP